MLIGLHLIRVRAHLILTDTIRCNDTADRFRRYAELREAYPESAFLFADVYKDGSIHVAQAHDPYRG